MRVRMTVLLGDERPKKLHLSSSSSSFLSNGCVTCVLQTSDPKFIFGNQKSTCWVGSFFKSRCVYCLDNLFSLSPIYQVVPVQLPGTLHEHTRRAKHYSEAAEHLTLSESSLNSPCL